MHNLDKPATFIVNAFSLNMLASLNATIKTEELTFEEVQYWTSNPCQWAIGHETTSVIVSGLLYPHLGDDPMRANRETVRLLKGDSLIVAQYVGPRLPEEATVLPEGATIKWVRVVID